MRTVGWVLGGLRSWRGRGAGFLLWRKNVHHTGFVALSGLTAMGLSVVGLGFAAGAGATSVCIVRCCGTPRPHLGPGRRLLRHAGHLRCAAAGSDRSDRPGHECLSFSSMAAVPVTYALTGLLTDFSNARVPFLIGGLLILLVAALAFDEPGTPSADHRSHCPSGRATLAGLRRQHAGTSKAGEGPAHEPGNYRNHHRCPRHHHLGDRDSSAHLSAEPGPARRVGGCPPGPALPKLARTPSVAQTSPVLPGARGAVRPGTDTWTSDPDC